VSPPRFFVDAPLAAGGSIRLPADVAHHAMRVLRLDDGAPIVLFDGRGGEYAARLRAAGATVLAQVDAFDPTERESPLHLTLVQALVATDKLDWIVEKAVELGVDRILVAPVQRCVVRLDAARAARRVRHWADVARAACCQCGRNRIPSVEFFGSFGSVLAALPAEGPRLMLLPTAGQDLCSAMAGGRAVLMVGPEGGFAENEIAQAAQAGFVTVRLGPRILRTETAGLAALAALQAMSGDLARAGARAVPNGS
jgi:16S rRNA (uracil1498-N3)-methyltransferase